MNSPTRLFDLIHYQKEHFPQDKAFNHKKNGEWVHFSTAETITIANNISRGLLQLGIKPGDKIAVSVVQNRAEWVFLDIGIQQIGAINVPVYPTITATQFEYIFNDSEVKYCFVGEEELYEKVLRIQNKVSSLIEVYTFDKIENSPFWEDIFTPNGQELVEELKAKANENDLATLIYTSGTTGEPKGVMLSHKNIVSNALAVVVDLGLVSGDRILSFLPLCHIFERTATYFQTYIGANVYYTGVSNLGGEHGDIQAVKPHFFNTVPRLLEKIYEKIINAGLQLNGQPRQLFDLALKLSETYEYDVVPHTAIADKWALVDQHIYSKWRMAMGGHIKGIICGAAALPTKIAQVFSAAGVPIREGYGLTETSPGLSTGRFTKGKGCLLGTVGPVTNGVMLFIDESDGMYSQGEGEILAKGPNVMLGYYNKPEKTAEVFKEIDGENWFCTGDIGTFIEHNGQQLLKITDRKKELLKTSGGKYVAPAPIENRFKEDFFIEQMMVVGENKKFVSALIVPSEENLKGWCSAHDLANDSLVEMIAHGKVIDFYQSIIDKFNPEFNHTQQIKKFQLIPQVWLPEHENGSSPELTPTLKLKRRVIRKKFENEINVMYQNDLVLTKR